MMTFPSNIRAQTTLIHISAFKRSACRAVTIYIAFISLRIKTVMIYCHEGYRTFIYRNSNVVSKRNTVNCFQEKTTVTILLLNWVLYEKFDQREPSTTTTMPTRTTANTGTMYSIYKGMIKPNSYTQSYLSYLLCRKTPFSVLIQIKFEFRSSSQRRKQWLPVFQL